MLAPPGPIAPGIYPGAGQAALLRTNEQQFLFQQQAIVSGQASIAVQLERINRTFYPFGASLQIWFTNSSLVQVTPGAFEIDAQTSDIDSDQCYCSGVGLTSLTGSSGFSGRIELPFIYAKYLRVLAKTITNAVFTNVLVTR